MYSSSGNLYIYCGLFSSIDAESMVLNWTFFRKTVIYVFCAQNSIIVSQYSVYHTFTNL